MNKPSFTHKLAARSGAFTLSLLLGALSASAFQTSTPGVSPGSTLTAPANGRPGHTALTPAAPVSSQVPASSLEDIRDIRQPRHLPTPLPWAAAAAGVIILATLVFGVWRWIRRGKFLAMLIRLSHLRPHKWLIALGAAAPKCDNPISMEDRFTQRHGFHGFPRNEPQSVSEK